MKFIIQDKFNLSEDELLDAASEAARRRVELLDVIRGDFITRTKDPIFKEGEYLCHTYELILKGKSK